MVSRPVRCVNNLEPVLRQIRTNIPGNVPFFVTFVTQITTIVFLRIRRPLSFWVAVTPAFFLPTPHQMSSSCDIHLTFAGDHTPLVLIAVLEAEALKFVPRSIRVANR